MANRFLILVLCFLVRGPQIAFAQQNGIPRPPPGPDEFNDDEDDEDDDEAPAMRPPPMPNPFNQQNGNSNGNSGRQDFNPPSAGNFGRGSMGGSPMSSGPAKFKFKII